MDGSGRRAVIPWALRALIAGLLPATVALAAPQAPPTPADTKPPAIVFRSPAACGATVDAAGDFTVEIAFDDSSGAGVNPDSTVIEILSPSGQDVGSACDILPSGIHGVIDGPLDVGEYTIRVRGEDRVGNAFAGTCAFFAAAQLLEITNYYTFPNPFNPASTNATFHLEIDADADVTVTMYDFAGQFVRTVFKGRLTAGIHESIAWGGEAQDNTDVANGVYLAYIEVTDGTRTETKIYKVAVWRD